MRTAPQHHRRLFWRWRYTEGINSVIYKKKKRKGKAWEEVLEAAALRYEPASADVGLTPCAVFLAGGAGSHLSEGQCSAHSYILGCPWVRCAFGQSFELRRCWAHLLPQLLPSGALSVTAVPPAPARRWHHGRCFCPPVPPCAAGQSLLGGCLCGSLRFTGTRVGFPPPQARPLRRGASVRLARPPGPALCFTGLCARGSNSRACPLHRGASVHLARLPGLALCFMGRVCTWLEFPALPSASQGCVHLSRLPGQASALPGWCALVWLPACALCTMQFMCTCFLSPPTLFVTGVMCSPFGCAGRAVRAAQGCTPPLYRRPGPLCTGYASAPLPSATCPILCAARVGCAGWVFFFFFFFFAAPLSVPRACLLFGATVHELLRGWEERLSLFVALQVPASPGFPHISAPPGTCLWGGVPAQGSSCLGLPPSLGTQLLPRRWPSFPFLCLHPLSYLISGSLACPLEACSLLLSPRGCFVGVVWYLDEFLIHLHGG